LSQAPDSVNGVIGPRKKDTVMPAISRVAHCASVLALLLGACSAQAQVEVCANTAAEILNGFGLANNDAVTIKVVQGDYALSESPNERIDGDGQYFGHDIKLMGGYNSSCSSRSLDPKLTTIRSNTDFHVSTRDSIYIYSIRFLDITGDVGLYAESSSFGPEETVSLSRVWVENVCHPSPVNCEGDNSALRISTNHLSLSQVVAVKNPTLGCTFKVFNTIMQTLSIVHSVFADNEGDGVCIYNAFGGEDFDVTIANSNFRNNAGGTDIRTDLTSNVTLLNNIYSVLDADPPPSNAPVASLNVNPQFINPSVSAYSILNSSPAVNSGNVSAAAFISQDINGGERHVGTAPDRGAYETTVEDSNLVFVTTTADQINPVPVGSMRAAILQSNSDSDFNTIRFDIAGACPRIINLAGPLPDITDRVRIEGYSQPGSAPNTNNFTFSPTICIGIRGDLSDNHAFLLPPSIGAGEFLDLSGVAFGGFDFAAIRLSGGSTSRIHGVQFGGTFGSVAIANNAVNVLISSSTDNVIGGDGNADRNLISEAYVAGLQLLDDPGLGTAGNTVENNLIGSTASGTQSAANNIGIELHSDGNIIKGNLISGNQTHGVLIDDSTATGNLIFSNRIGLKASTTVACLPPCPPGFYALGNIGMGVLVQGGASNNDIWTNTIAYNGGKGIRFLEGQRNTSFGNSIYENGALGIDTGSAGVNPINNDGDPAEQATANRGLNWPFLTSASGGANSGVVQGTLFSIDGDYTLQVFSDIACNALGHGDARRYHTSDIVTISGAAAGENGSVQFAVPFQYSGILNNRGISVTATDHRGNTSELSNCMVYDQVLGDAIFANGFEL